MKAILLLEDGTVFTGESFGAQDERIAEVICNTAVVGYQEILTDPANAGKILVLTYPLIGNYGVAPKFNESKGVWAQGLVIKEKSRIYSNWQAKASLEDFVKEHNLLAISKVDTRSLAVHLRASGSMLGIISTLCFDPKKLLLKIGDYRRRNKSSLLAEISVNAVRRLGKANGKYKIAVLDLGVQNSLIQQIERLKAQVVLLPYNTTPKEILKYRPDGLIIAGGLEEDPGLNAVVDNIKLLLGKVPILGVCCGHQVLAKAIGVKINKMKSGHHGLNYPVHKPGCFKGEITSQNHSWVVDAGSLSRSKQAKASMLNLNDQTIEGLESRQLKFMGIQYFPAWAGPEEVNEVFKNFFKLFIE
jgi:carbamoyl-phosphate synthase small subunit